MTQLLDDGATSVDRRLIFPDKKHRRTVLIHPREDLLTGIRFVEYPKELKQLKKPQVLQIRIDATWECYDSDESEYGYNCIRSYSIFSMDVRKNMNECHPLPYEDRFAVLENNGLATAEAQIQ